MAFYCLSFGDTLSFMGTTSRYYPEIEFVNHASFIVQHENFRILVDPWLTGHAFNLGWALQIPTPQKYLRIDSLNNVTHIIFTHEHPDHFNPVWLSTIPEEKRREIMVFFQKTKDRRVINFCERLGFQITELPPRKEFQISPEISLVINPVPFIDSFQVLKIRDFVILNLNDCVTSKIDLLWVKRQFNVDLMFTQFSYANWAGDPDETEYRKGIALEALEKLKQQINFLKPTYVIPFASFVYFSHEENVHLNDQRNSVLDAVYEIEAAGSIPVVLSPGDIWNPKNQWDNTLPIKKYMDSMDVSQAEELEKAKSVSKGELISLAKKYKDRIELNNRLALWLIAKYPFRVGRTMYLYLNDLNETIEFNPRNGKIAFLEGKTPKARIEMASDSFALILKFDYGSSTLAINGRMRASSAAYKELLRAFAVANLNSGGRFLSVNLLVEYNFVHQAIRRVIAG